MGHYGGSYKVTYDLHKKYGDMRLLDTPICGAVRPSCHHVLCLERGLVAFLTRLYSKFT